MRPTDLIMFAAIFAIMYFLLIRPQQKRMKEHQAMLAGVKRGDWVVTSGGVKGKVVKVHEAEGELEVEIAKGVNVRVIRSMLSSVVNKTEPAKT